MLLGNFMKLKEMHGNSQILLDFHAFERPAAPLGPQIPKGSKWFWGWLASVLAPDGNGVKAAMQLVGLLRLKGCVVTGDALHCHRAMAAAIVARGGDYVLAVKGNQPGLARAAAAVLAAAGKRAKTARTSGKGHGREETRIGFVAPAPGMAESHDFPGLAAVACVESRRGADQPTRRTFLLSKRFTPERMLDIVRTH